ncbi:Sec23/Sec24 domain containing protein [Theileria equi strain WA]|uniref:Sec23/Sec24 domain containing protein n=1 Tax=Theileria equi strain WA TaxID=1537102 RepID=L0AY81_THEEQ|nr:Sec23/Sec24 domain containing protein [Theileria equi strain WA]AFZ80520.1 Sec23/Sec24 domain containing protein [Theileria equi strain WA]|eukprot:XP_004830186.1 Sec23/Sec24 domain containing protein [Theileria equi strain WA]
MSTNWPPTNKQGSISSPFPGQVNTVQQSPFPGQGSNPPQGTPFPGVPQSKAPGVPLTASLDYNQQIPPAFSESIPPPTPPPKQAAPVPLSKAQDSIKSEPSGKNVKSSLQSHVFHEDLGVTTLIGQKSSSISSKTEDDALESLQLMNSTSHFVKTTVSLLPSSSTLLQKAQINLGYIIRPLAPLPEGEAEIPLVNYGTDPITRCTQCRTYINPYVRTDPSKRFWICNLCETSNEMPARYGNNLVDEQSLPPEFNCAVMEYMASADYTVRPPQPPTIMFVIDVSSSAVNSRMLEVVCNTIADLIRNDELPGGPRTMVGIMTYDTSVHFYQLSKGVENLQVLVVSDLEDLFLPLSGEILLNLSESADDILKLLELLPSTWKDNNIVGSAMGSAIRAAHYAMKHVGGKMCVFTSSPSYFGDFALNSSQTARDKKGPKLQPLDKCKEFSTMVCQTQVSLELFVCTPQNLNLPALHHLSSQTSGSVHYFPLKNHQGNLKLSQELRHVITRETCWESVMRIRISKGWKITNWFGNCYIRGSDLMVLPNCHSDHTFSITFQQEDGVVPKKVAYFQTAFLHTNSHGERRIRVFNSALPISGNLNDVLLSLNPEAALVTTAQLAINAGLNGKLPDARNMVQNICSKISASLSALTPIPDSCKIFIMYILGLLKSTAFIENINPDLRIYHWLRLRSLPLEDIIAYSYPRLVPIHDLPNDIPSVNSASIPPPLHLTHESLTQEGAYLLENGESMIIWIGRNISPQWLQAVFDAPSFDHLQPHIAESCMDSQKNPTAIRVSSVIKAIRDTRLPYMSLKVIKQGDESEPTFYSHLIHDKTQGMLITLKDFISSMAPRTQLHVQPTLG